MLGHEREKRRGEERRGEESLVPWLEEGWWWGGIEGANVPRPGNTVSVLHPLSLRPLAYFYSSLSETWVGSSPFPLEEFFLLLLLLLPSPSLFPLLCVYTQPSGCVYLEEGDAAAATTCKHSPVLFAIRMPPKPPPVREEPPSLSTLYMYMYMYIYIYIYTSILLANGKISSSLLRYEEKSARWNVSFFTPFSQVFFTGMLLWKGGGNYRSEKFFFDSFEGLEIRWFVWKFIRFKDSRVRIHLGWSTGPARSKFKSGGIFLRLFALVWKFIRCKDSRLPNLFRDRNLVRSTFIVILFFFRIVLWRKFTLEEFFRIFNVIYWNWSIFTIIVLLFFLELFCEESLRWRNFFEFLM